MAAFVLASRRVGKVVFEVHEYERREGLRYILLRTEPEKRDRLGDYDDYQSAWVEMEQAASTEIKTQADDYSATNRESILRIIKGGE